MSSDSSDTEDTWVHIDDSLSEGDVLVAVDPCLSGSAYVFMRVVSFTKTGRARLARLVSSRTEEYCTKGALEYGCRVTPTDALVDGAKPIPIRPYDKELASVRFPSGSRSWLLEYYDPQREYWCRGYG